MFSALSEAELKIVIGAMQSVKLKVGDVVIKEGDDGDNLYVVESGVLKCTKFLKVKSLSKVPILNSKKPIH